MNIITDEEMSALLAGPHEVEGFRPLCLYAFDDVSYRHALGQGLSPEVSLRRVEPQDDWQWQQWFGKSQFGLFQPNAHEGQGYRDALLAAPGIFALDDAAIDTDAEPWPEALARALAAWHHWLGRQRILLLEDHPFQGRQICAQIASLGPRCTLVSDGESLNARLTAEEFDWLVSDLALAEDDAIHVLGHSLSISLPVILLSGHDQSLVDGAARLLSLRGVQVVGAFTKPLESARLLPILFQGYEGSPPLPSHRPKARTIRTWEGISQGVLGRLDDAVAPNEARWLLLASLESGWETVREQLEHEGRAVETLSLVIRPQDELLAHSDRFYLALQARLAGASLALLIDRPEQLSFELLERLPLEAILLGWRLQPLLEQGGMLETFLMRAREKGYRLYLDDPCALLDDPWWEERGFHGRW